ncbi:sugar phosphate isomerase/epimerase family protein [Microvirga sp. M2]|uniref:sugar phosphate isomerase/epimerase family protein n=1 Tax=Microvirga sp. M2 TaxID=3073270 RepID=UPI0039C0377D
MARVPFSVNHYVSPGGMSLQEFLDKARNSGFEAVGLTESALRAQPPPALLAMLKARGLRVSSINTAGFFLQEGDAAREQERRNAWLLEQAAGCAGSALNIIVGGSTALDLPDAREAAASGLAAFAREARRAGVQLVVEPLHFLNVRTKSCFNTIGQMEILFDRVPDLMLNADLYHLWWDPDLERLLSGDSVPIGLFQICDVAIPDGESVPRRVPLGEGFVPWVSHVRAVRRAFPTVPIELELFADQLPGRRLDDLLSDSSTLLSTLLEE